MQKATLVSHRIYSIDILRGFAMIIMALDHVRDYFYGNAFLDSPTNLLTTTPALFFTRWITHFCAPTFLFLSGVSAYLMSQRKTRKELSVFLIKRGLWLIFVELFIVTLAWTFDPLYHLFILQVIWAIGISMLILGVLVWLPGRSILIAGLLIIFFHNLMDPAVEDKNVQFGLLWNLIYHGFFTIVPIWAHHNAIIVYAFLPWTGIMLLGYGMGKLFTSAYDTSRRKILFRLGAAAIVVFFALRFYNHYGDPAHWQLVRDRFYSWLSVLNVTKYPPSLDYIMLTLGVAFILLAMFDRLKSPALPFVRVFGRVPFFFYVIHIFLIHALTVVLFYIQGYQSKDIAPQHSPFLFRPDNFGFGLSGVYLVWIAVILILYPFCKSYDDYKSGHRKWWLSYI